MDWRKGGEERHWGWREVVEVKRNS